MNTDALQMTDQPNATAPNACPASEALSEYYEATREGVPDGGLPDVHRHVLNCPQCQAVMRFYKSIDGLVGKAAAPDDAFVDRILRECHRAADNDRLLSPVVAPQQPAHDDHAATAAADGHTSADDASAATARPVFMRVHAPRIAMAAGLLLLGGSIALHYLFTKNLSDENQFLAQQQAELLQNTTATQRRLPLVPPAEGPQMAAITPGDLHQSGAAPDAQPVPSNNIQAVSFQNDRPAPAQSTEATRHIDRVVRHTWLVRDLKDASQFLSAFNGQHGITVQTSQHTPGRLIVSLRGIRDTTLQKLVDALEQKHWALVSPMFPQPRQASRIDFTNRPVTYTVRLVESNRPDFRRLQ
ncbi:MAG: hypothetical protein ACI4WT_12875 [Oligosphaeraceae bacterium]